MKLSPYNSLELDYYKNNNINNNKSENNIENNNTIIDKVKKSRIEEIKEAISNRSYEINIDDIAKSMAKNLL